MENGPSDSRSRVAIVVDVGRHAIRVGLTDDRGVLLHDSVRAYEAHSQPTVSGAIATFSREACQSGLPSRLAVSVAGIARGDTVSVTNGRWRVSRSGLAAMIKAPPVIVNDFAATAWAVSSPASSGRAETLVVPGVRPQEPGTFCIMGVGSGLGVAVLSRDPRGTVCVIPTEAGNCAFPSGLKEAEPLMAEIGIRHGFATAEMLVSAPGFVAIYAAIAKRRGVSAVTTDPKELVRLAKTSRDPLAVEALSVFIKALWHLAGNLVLSSGAWDGLILTGGLAAALRSDLQRPELAAHFALNGAYKRMLSAVPSSLMTFRNAELEGAAFALLAEDARYLPS